MRNLSLKLFIALHFFILISPDGLAQNDYVPGMEKFPDIDITSYILQAEFQKTTSQVKAQATVVFELRQEETDSVIFELDRRVKISNVYDKNGDHLRFRQPKNADSITIRFSQPIVKNSRVQIDMEYICDFPLLKKSEPNANKGYYFFLRKWYPVNDYFCDSAPAEFTFTVPGGYSVLTCGREVEAEKHGNRKICHWQSFGPSNCYFVFAGPFERFIYKDQKPVLEIYMDTEELPIAESAKTKTREILRYFENLFCPYPFPVLYLVTAETEMNPVGLNGLTFIDYEQFSDRYVYSYMTWTHELSHHWFGGILQAKSPQDYCLLIEGPAEYFTRLYIRSTRGEDRFRSDLRVQRMAALAGNEVVPITQYHELEKGGEYLYAKGSYIFHMLRHILGENAFFEMMTTLLQDFNEKPAGIQDLLHLAEKVSGKSLDWFFEQWVYGTGIPEYKMEFEISPIDRGTWTISGYIRQKFNPFQMPVEIVALGTNSTKTATVFVDSARTSFRFETGFKPEKILLDPEYKILRWDDDIRVWLFTSRGRRLVRQKNYPEAERLLDRALEMNPSCSWAAMERASLAELQERYKDALGFYLQALEGDMDFLLTPWPYEQIKQILYVSVGYCYDVQGKREDAVSWYKKTIQLGRDPRFVYYYDKAVEYLTKPARKKRN